MLSQNKIKQIKQVANELKKCADNQSYNPPRVTKVQLTPSWRYKKEIFLLCAKTNFGAKVEKDFDELDKLHQEYESWRAKTLSEDNEEEFRTLVDCLKGTLYDLADTFHQIAHISRDELTSEKPAETEQKIPHTENRGINAFLKKVAKSAWQIFTRNFWETFFDRIFRPR